MKNPYVTYKKTSIETLHPGRIILLLFNAAIEHLDKAELALKEEFSIKQQEKIHNSLMRVQSIFHELQNCLNFDASKELANTLYRLYDYIGNQIVIANSKKSIEPIKNIKNVLIPLKESWEEMLRQYQQNLM